ncbi:metal ABC transporter solute-binding protein, Zn/Mn family [Chitinimonas sp.]|uniref:metal ABC transporter solute-binding protein, Zn/Mn family n=1 Tax=Chitinimonas sp. TaxID=1934313 RepID=UPI0035B0F524
MRKLISLLALVLSLGCRAEPLPVVATFSILGDLVQQVGGDKVVVTTLVGVDGDAHVYQPGPRDMHALGKARLLVSNGLGFEPWTDKLVKSSHYRGDILQASSGISSRQLPGGHHADPHAWQDPARVRRYIANIEAALVKLDAANAAYYRQRAAAYSAQLQALEAWADAQLASIAPAKRMVITSHDAFGYLGERFGIRLIAAQGLSTDAEPTARDIGKLIQQMRQQKIKAVFVENISNPRLVQQLAREAGATPGPELYSDALSKSGGPAADYLSLMRHNISALLAGMRLN